MESKSCCVPELSFDFELLVLDIDAFDRAVDNRELFNDMLLLSRTDNCFFCLHALNCTLCSHE
eukprot:566128-Rhodomonas_salina.1